MPFKGNLKQGTAVNIEVIAGGGNGGSTALTVAKVVKQDRYSDVDAVTIAPGTSGSTLLAVGATAVRLIVQVHLPIGGSALVKVTQGAAVMFEDPITADTDFVYDIVP